MASSSFLLLKRKNLGLVLRLGLVGKVKPHYMIVITDLVTLVTDFALFHVRILAYVLG